MIAVVIPLYNKVRHIKRALDSVLAQTFTDFEAIVVNDGSTDGSQEVVAQYADPRLRLINQENAGVSAARNRGVTEASGDLIAFLDADDEWLPGFLDTVLRLRDRFPGCGAYAAAYEVVERSGVRHYTSFKDVPPPPWEGIVTNYFRSDMILTSAVAIPKRVFAAVGPFPVGVLRGEDTDMWCRIALTYPVAFSAHVGTVYHRDAENRVYARAPVPQWQEYRPGKTIANALRAGSLPPGVTAADLCEYLNARFIMLANVCTAAGHRVQTREYLRQSAATRLHRRRWFHAWLCLYLPAWALDVMLAVWRSARSFTARRLPPDWRSFRRIRGERLQTGPSGKE